MYTSQSFFFIDVQKTGADSQRFKCTKEDKVVVLIWGPFLEKVLLTWRARSRILK